MAGFYNDPGDKHGGAGLPAGHWMHAVAAKEKARLAKKGGKGMKSAKDAAGGQHETDPTKTEGDITSPASVQAVNGTPVKEGAAC